MEYLTASSLWNIYHSISPAEQQEILDILSRKKKLSVNELICHMKHKGITFTIMNEQEAKHFLQEHNYYFKLASYRGNYSKYQRGPHIGKYENLDFAYLKELSTIDMHLRYLILQMCLDIEHQLKVMLLNDIEQNPDENGYSIVKKFDSNQRCRQKILKQAPASYAHDLIEKYHTNPDFPVWVLLELISFGDLCNLYRTYTELYPKRKLPKHSLLNPIRNLRNAAAHSNCLIYKLKVSANRKTRPQKRNINDISNIVAQISTISRSSRKNYLQIIPIHDFAVLLYWYHRFVKSEGLQKKRRKELYHLFYRRMPEHHEYFSQNNYIRHAYIFTLKLVKYFFPVIDNECF